MAAGSAASLVASMADHAYPTPPPRRKNSTDSAQATPQMARRPPPHPKLNISAAASTADPEAGKPEPQQEAWGMKMPELLSSLDKTKVASYLQSRMKDVTDGAFQTAKSSLSFGERFTLAFLDKVKRWSRRGFTHIFLFAVLMLYNAIGACVMMILEKPAENQHLDLDILKQGVVDRIAEHTNGSVASNGSLLLNVTELRVVMQKELDQLLNTSWTQFDLYRWHPDPDDNPWGFWGSLFFCFTIHSTIGEFIWGIILKTSEASRICVGHTVRLHL